MGKETIRCSGCGYCKSLPSQYGTRNGFICGHPDSAYINTYFKEHGLKKMPGFLGYGKPYSREVPLKTSPAWCPEKQAGEYREWVHIWEAVDVLSKSTSLNREEKEALNAIRGFLENMGFVMDWRLPQ